MKCWLIRPTRIGERMRLHCKTACHVSMACGRWALGMTVALVGMGAGLVVLRAGFLLMVPAMQPPSLASAMLCPLPLTGILIGMVGLGAGCRLAEPNTWTGWAARTTGAGAVNSMQGNENSR